MAVNPAVARQELETALERLARLDTKPVGFVPADPLRAFNVPGMFGAIPDRYNSGDYAPAPFSPGGGASPAGQLPIQVASASGEIAGLSNNVSSQELVAAGVSSKYAPNLAKQINSLDASVRPRYVATVKDFYSQYGSQGYDLDINQAARTTAEQRALRATGVKAAAPRNSWHTAGGAADFTIYKNGKRDFGTRANNAYQKLLAPIAKARGLHAPISGDVGHFQAVEFPKVRGGRLPTQFLTPESSLAYAGTAPAIAPAPAPATDEAPQLANLWGRAPIIVPANASEAELVRAGLKTDTPAAQETIDNLTDYPDYQPRQLSQVEALEPSTVPRGPYGADAVIQAAMSGDPGRLKSAMDNVVASIIQTEGLAGAGKAQQRLQTYFDTVAKTAPGAVRVAQSAFAQNPQMRGAVPASLQPELDKAFAALPPRQTASVPPPPMRPNAMPAQVVSLAPVAALGSGAGARVSGGVPLLPQKPSTYDPRGEILAQTTPADRQAPFAIPAPSNALAGKSRDEITGPDSYGSRLERSQSGMWPMGLDADVGVGGTARNEFATPLGLPDRFYDTHSYYNPNARLQARNTIAPTLRGSMSGGAGAGAVTTYPDDLRRTVPFALSGNASMGAGGALASIGASTAPRQSAYNPRAEIVAHTSGTSSAPSRAGGPLVLDVNPLVHNPTGTQLEKFDPAAAFGFGFNNPSVRYEPVTAPTNESPWQKFIAGYNSGNAPPPQPRYPAPTSFPIPAPAPRPVQTAPVARPAPQPMTSALAASLYSSPKPLAAPLALAPPPPIPTISGQEGAGILWGGIPTVPTVPDIETAAPAGDYPSIVPRHIATAAAAGRAARPYVGPAPRASKAPSTAAKMLGGILGGALGGPLGGLAGSFVGGKLGGIFGQGGGFLGGGSMLPPISQQVLGIPYSGGASSSYTPMSYRPANFSPVSGGSRYAYTTGVGAGGRPMTSYTNNAGTTYSFYQSPSYPGATY